VNTVHQNIGHQNIGHQNIDSKDQGPNIDLEIIALEIKGLENMDLKAILEDRKIIERTLVIRLSHLLEKKISKSL